MDRYAVIGNPIGHSKSPFIHACFAAQTGQTLHYEAIEAELDHFPEAVRQFLEEGGKGMNVTVPFKLQAYKLADQLSPRAEYAKAVNTLILETDGSLTGDNTDGVGLVRDLSAHHVSIQERRVLVIGAGGAVRGVLGPILEHEPARLVIVNRTADKARELAKIFAHANPGFGTIEGIGFEALAERAGKETFDLVINGSSASLSKDLPPLPDGLLGKQAIAYDMAYGAECTVFQRWANEQGAIMALDGLGMLVEQAAESFLLWRGVRPDTTDVRRTLRTAQAQDSLS